MKGSKLEIVDIAAIIEDYFQVTLIESFSSRFLLAL
jgi:hypothetical protein